MKVNAMNEDREVLIARMLEARTGREVEASEQAADEWLRENPGDTRVAAAGERLARRGARVRAPERKVNRATAAAFAAVFLAAAFLAGALTGSFYAAFAAGLLVALPVAEFVWGMLYDRASGDGER